MGGGRIDPAPRQYPPFVGLKRRVVDGHQRVPSACSVADVETWLLDQALQQPHTLDLVDQLAWRLVAAGFPLDRFSVHVGTLHPQLLGFAWNWLRADTICDEVQVAADSLDTDAYRRNPLAQVIGHGRTIRALTADPDDVARYPLIADLAKSGIAEYIAMPMSGAAYHNAVTLATRQPGGFSDEQRSAMARLLKLFALHVERHIALRIADNALVAYLGELAAGKVLSGSIRRGAGDSIRAVIWMSDLRGFTGLTERLGGADMISLLNAYFEEMAGAVLAQGGEVLKFIGDGLLAAFPIEGDGKLAAARAVAAARDALARFERLNAQPPVSLAGIKGWHPLRSGIALHEGEVFFGNIGAPQRLDFTVIGPTVNQASRVEALQKTLARPVLITDAVARLLDEELEPLGAHALRGVPQPVAIFGLKSA
ncbi:MAG: adenylate/guanylate cyclase domain-containing protein [Reyranellaceae bacterium]